MAWLVGTQDGKNVAVRLVYGAVVMLEVMVVVDLLLVGVVGSGFLVMVMSLVVIRRCVPEWQALMMQMALMVMVVMVVTA
jgi:hypothetical protein